MGRTLTVLIPLVVLAYALWLIVRMIKSRKQGNCGCGCGGCPIREGCEIVQKQAADKSETNKPATDKLATDKLATGKPATGKPADDIQKEE